MLKKKATTEKRAVSRAEEYERAEDYFKEQVQNPGFLFCLTDKKQQDPPEDFIRKIRQEYPQATIMVYFGKKKKGETTEPLYRITLDKSDFNLWGNLKSGWRKKLKEKQFDLFVIFATGEDKHCKKIAWAVKSRLKAGQTPIKEAPWTDINLKNPGTEWGYEDFYKALKLYFKQLNIKFLS